MILYKVFRMPLPFTMVVEAFIFQMTNMHITLLMSD